MHEARTAPSLFVPPLVPCFKCTDLSSQKYCKKAHGTAKNMMCVKNKVPEKVPLVTKCDLP